jgi:glycosyltransferase involved in cell wall biosynthesis
LSTRGIPAITVALPTYNGQAYVRESIDSILAQDTDDFELIVCDDASTDDTWSIVESYRGPRCRLLRNEKNQGLFPTLNRLMREAQSPLVHLFSQDDRMRPDCLSRTCDFAAKHPEVAMIYCHTHFIDSAGRRAPESLVTDNTPTIVPSLLAAQIMFYFGSIAGNIANVSLRKTAFEEVGEFREDLEVSGDYEYWTRLSETHLIGFQRERLIELRTHANQFSQQWSSGEKFLSENWEVHRRLLSRLPAGELRQANHFQRWVIDVNAFHYAMRSVLRGESRTALRALRLLSSRTALLPLALRWIISGNGRLIRRPVLVHPSARRESADSPARNPASGSSAT